MKSLIVYYSRTGMTKKVAEAIKEKTGWDLEVIIDNKDRSGALGYMVSGKDAMLKKEADIKDTVIDPAEYDLVIIGSPIWAFTASTPVMTYLKKQNGKFKKLAFFCTMGGSGHEKAFIEMEKAAGLKPEKTLALADREIADGSYMTKLDEFIKSLV